MIKRKFVLLVIVVLLASLVLAPGAALAKATVTEFSGTETVVALIDPGAATFPGGNLHGRGRIWEVYHATNDPRVNGTVIVVSNANFDSNFEGVAWGTFRVEPEGYDGTWEARWHSNPTNPDVITAVGHGTGELEGLKAWWRLTYVTEVDVVISGRILDPQGE